MSFNQLFKMLIMSSDCWLTLIFGLYYNRSDIDGVKSKAGLFSKYNPTCILDSHTLVWPSLAQQTSFEQKLLTKKYHLPHKVTGFDIKAT